MALQQDAATLVQRRRAHLKGVEQAPEQVQRHCAECGFAIDLPNTLCRDCQIDRFDFTP